MIDHVGNVWQRISLFNHVWKYFNWSNIIEYGQHMVNYGCTWLINIVSIYHKLLWWTIGWPWSPCWLWLTRFNHVFNGWLLLIMLTMDTIIDNGLTIFDHSQPWFSKLSMVYNGHHNHLYCSTIVNHNWSLSILVTNGLPWSFMINPHQLLVSDDQSSSTL